MLARALAPAIGAAPGAVLLRSDTERKALFGRAEQEPLPAEAYTPDVSLRVFAMLADKARRVIAAGHSAVVDAVFAKPGERALIEESARMLRVPFRSLFLHTDLATRLSRIGCRRADASDADARVASRQESYDLGNIDWPVVDAGGAPEETLARARTQLSVFTKDQGADT
jgi:uncharacterized protein